MFWFCIRKVVVIKEVYSKISSSQWGAWMKQRAEIHRLTELWFSVHLMSTDNFSVGHHGLYSWEKSELYNRLSLLLLLGHQFLETLLLFLRPAFQCLETKLHKLIWKETKCEEMGMERHSILFSKMNLYNVINIRTLIYKNADTSPPTIHHQ